MLEIDELRQLSDAATKGPWVAEVGGSEGYYLFGARGSKPVPIAKGRARVGSITWGTFEQDKANAKFIEACVNYVREQILGDK